MMLYNICHDDSASCVSATVRGLNRFQLVHLFEYDASTHRNNRMPFKGIYKVDWIRHCKNNPQ